MTEVSFVKVKSHATDSDIAEGISTVAQRFGNHMADEQDSEAVDNLVDLVSLGLLRCGHLPQLVELLRQHADFPRPD